MLESPLHRDRRSTLWYYAGLGVVRKALAALGVLILLVITGLSIASRGSDQPSATPSASITYTPPASATAPVSITKDIVLAHKSVQVNDPTLAKGQTVVRQKGSDGIRRQTIVAGRVTSDVVVKPATDTIIAIGTKVASAPAAPKTQAGEPATEAPAPAPATTKAAPAPAAPKSNRVTISRTVTCSTRSTIAITGLGTSPYVSISGPVSKSGSGAVQVSGPAGTYTATVTTTGPGRIAVRWAGTCSAS